LDDWLRICLGNEVKTLLKAFYDTLTELKFGYLKDKQEGPSTESKYIGHLLNSVSGKFSLSNKKQLSYLQAVVKAMNGSSFDANSLSFSA